VIVQARCPLSVEGSNLIAYQVNDRLDVLQRDQTCPILLIIASPEACCSVS
jgi:hypothetical protein